MRSLVEIIQTNKEASEAKPMEGYDPETLAELNRRVNSGPTPEWLKAISDKEARK